MPCNPKKQNGRGFAGLDAPFLNACLVRIKREMRVAVGSPVPAGKAARIAGPDIMAHMPSAADHAIELTIKHIATGEIAEGEELPPQRDLMAQWRLSPVGATLVTAALRERRLAVRHPDGKGNVIAAGARQIAQAIAGIGQETA